ncbi:MAG TPA: transcription-repair coupling factor [Chloroflexi bacterium]|nr:transcription-repair coupling factor [Chloroflexota bacterium]
MNISGLLVVWDRLEPYRALREDLKRGNTPPPLGLLRATRPALLAALARDLARPIVIIAGTVERAKELTQSLRDWMPDPARVLRFAEPPTLFYERAPWPEEVISNRMYALSALFGWQPDAPPLIVTSVRAAMQRTLPFHQFRLGVRDVQVGGMLERETALTRWSGLGYEPVSVVEAPGQLSHRGGIIDIFPPSEPWPVRIELFGPQVESIRRFDPATQRSLERIEHVTITPAREALPRHGPRVAERIEAQIESSTHLLTDIRAGLDHHIRHLAAAMPFPGIEFYLPYFYTDPATLLNHLPSEAVLVLDDPAELAATWAALEEDAVNLRASAEAGGNIFPDFPLPYVTWDEVSEYLLDRPALVLGRDASEGEIEAASSPLAEYFTPVPHFGGQLKTVLEHISRLYADGGQVVVVSQQAGRLAELWAEDHEYVPPSDQLPQAPRSPLTFVQGALAEGWSGRGLDMGQSYSALHLLTDTEIFGWRRPEPRRRIRRRKVAPETFFSDLTPGDLVVHIEYGIGIFRGLVTRAMEGMPREYLLVEYAEGDRLYVPIHQADRLSRYIGSRDHTPRIHRLGSTRWRMAKRKAKKATEKVARELLDLYAARELAQGHAFPPDDPWQMELEASFPYFETEDQLKAIADVKADMERPRPMDRLICGDVGYGKTEVALRAAFKAVSGGKQVAILVPTTVLAQQHYVTFRQRLAPFPVEVEMLSRFRSRAEQQKILARLAAGQVDIVIGTHRLLQRDVVFADLGLLIIDEEQRFGVTHKERLKRMRTEVDVLTLTATPIPRTLYMAITGVRDISTIETPPEERVPVITYVGEYDAQLVRRAILRELERGGQVFYVHNRVQTIETVRHRLETLVPEATFATAHGQMRERTLEQVMLRFVSGEVDVLVCTSIIESGLDIPNANTLIVERADRFGLAQLYQLRGRVGRGAQQAYTYLFHGRVTRLTPEARQRLETMREATELGAGYTIAMRDLEIRGAGDLLGTRQSGHIAAVGFDLYTRLLSRAVKVLKAQSAGKPPPPEPMEEIRIDLPLSVRLPDEYVPDIRLRLQIYRRVANMYSMEQIEEMERELEDRFGSLPSEVQNLMYQLRLKVLACQAGVSVIGVEGGRLALRISEDVPVNQEELRRRLSHLQSTSGRISVSHRKIWLPMQEAHWRERLVSVLQVLGAQP